MPVGSATWCSLNPAWHRRGVDRPLALWAAQGGAQWHPQQAACLLARRSKRRFCSSRGCSWVSSRSSLCLTLA